MYLPASRKSMRPMALPLALALHLLALYALDKWSNKHHHADERAQKEVTMLLLPAAQKPPKPEKPSAAERSSAKAQSFAAAPKHETEKSISAPDSMPAPGPAPAAVPADPVIPPAPSLVNTDPAALVKANGYVDTRSDLQKAIEAHGGTVAIQPKDKYVAFAETADFAQIPYCAGKDGLKHDPPHIGPVQLGGIFALPFVADAAIRGKCKIIGH